ncbi:MAG: D-glycero-beta-D-manno-heptose-7-phosphate kinase [Magnetococcales bacterium]|nr:D-glycero-beta-D-manno-heptose-7-phosphate kinase [Magnetococcales bacterium]
MVIGDLMLDRYLWGSVSRISPEAPVPVVRLKRETEQCGGAANVAFNLVNLGIQPIIAGVVGRDSEGRRLQGLLNSADIDIQGVITVDHIPTITKTRIIGGHQQMLRLDREVNYSLPQNHHQMLMDRILTILKTDTPAVILLSDYAKGVLTPTLCQEIIATARRMDIPVLVDPKGSAYHKYRGASVLSPNRSELATAVRRPDEELATQLMAGEILRENLELDYLVVTLSELGIALVDDAGIRRIPSVAREVFDVSGAGDTVISTLAAGLAAGLDRMDALVLANVAAGVVVGKLGTLPITRPELSRAVSNENALGESKKICNWEQVGTLVDGWRNQGDRIVFTNGCFDLLHAGHVSYLEAARMHGHRLVVGLNSDSSVKRLKGESRPIIQQQDRARVLSAIASVDAVVIFDQDTPLELIQRLRPDVLAKGADYSENEVVGGDVVKSWGGSIELIPLITGRSSSTIVEKINKNDAEESIDPVSS